MARWSIFVIALALAGCSSSSQKAPEKRQATVSEKKPDAAPEDSRRRLVAFGNSLTAGFGVEPGNSFPDFLQREIDQRGYKWRVINAGVSGDTSTDGVARLPSVIAYKPEIVILELGANDGLRGLPIETTKANLETIIEELRKSTARVVLAGMTLPPNYGPDYIKPFEKVFKDLSQKYRLTFIPFLLTGVGGDARYMQNDGLHPNVEGNRRVAQNVIAAIESVLR